MPDLQKAINEIEDEVGIPKGFFKDLLDEDDWSFIIKIHALVEALISFQIVKSLHKEELSSVISFLELSNNRTGKLAFVKNLDILPKKFRRFIKNLSEIRNAFTHNVSNIGVTIDEYFKTLSKQKRKEYVEGVCLGRKENIELPGVSISYTKFVRENLKIGIWYGCMGLIYEIYIFKFEAETKQAYYELAETLISEKKARDS